MLPGVVAGVLAGVLASVAATALLKGTSSMPPVAPATSSAARNNEESDPVIVDRLAAHRQAVLAFAQEPFDPEWGPRKERSVRGDLATISQRGTFEIASVGCRTRVCLATVRFRSYADAQQGWHVLLMNRSRCASEVVLETPADPGAPYETTVVYDCPRSDADL